MPHLIMVTRRSYRLLSGPDLTLRLPTLTLRIVCATRQLNIYLTRGWTPLQRRQFRLSILAVGGALIFGDPQLTQHLCTLSLVACGVWITCPTRSASTPPEACE